MFRLSQILKSVIDPNPPAARLPPKGPVVIWNLVRRCNLSCRHCYSASSDRDFDGELSLSQITQVMDDLSDFGVPALILSGGEPLLRPDLFQIAAHARGRGFHLSLSTNGTLIDQPMARHIADAGFDYVGISLDGIGATHDRFRGQDGAFAASLAGIRHCRALGVKVGLRFTMTRDNAADMPALLRLMEEEGIEKFYLSHLNYAGRGRINRAEDADAMRTRAAMDVLIATALDDCAHARPREIVTGNNDADGAYFLMWVQRRYPDRAAALESRLRQWGGNAAGINVANIDNQGWVHPDTMWWHERLGNVRQRPFSAIWQDVSNPLMAALKQRPRAVGGRCAQCRFLALCNGNSRVRAERVHGDSWAEDPGCYLTDAEIAP